MQNRKRPTPAIIKGILVVPFAVFAHLQGACAEELSKAPGIRDVTPPGINRIYRSIEPAVVPESNLPKFADIQVLPNGTLRSDTKSIQLYGITLPDRKKLCNSSMGYRWTCGVTAYVVWRNLLQSRSITCNILIESEKNLLGQCKIEQTDISEWLLQEGWAELAPSANEKRYVDAATLAKTRAVGLWGNGPPENPDKPQKRY